MFSTMNSAQQGLTHYGLMMPYGDMYLVYTGSGNGLLPDSSKPLPEPMLIIRDSKILWHSPESNSQETLENTILEMSLKIIN